MICNRCQKTLRSFDGLKCSLCESKFHIRCISMNKDVSESGDRGVYQWRCATCHSSVNRLQSESKEHLLNTINTLCEKFELIFKTQLPKMNGELSQLKCATNRLVKQNEDILRKMEDNEKRDSMEKRTLYRYRSRNLSLIPGPRKAFEANESVPMLGESNKSARYRTRRRSYLLNRMFHLLHRKSNRNVVSPRNRRY